MNNVLNSDVRLWIHGYEFAWFLIHRYDFMNAYMNSSFEVWMNHEFISSFWIQLWIQILNCMFRNCWIPTSCRSIVVVGSALWQQANTAMQQCIAMQLKGNLQHFQQADCSRHYRWAPPSMTVEWPHRLTLTQDTRLLGVVPQALSMTPSMDAWAALSMTPSMDADTRHSIAWCCHTAGTIE